MIFQAGATAQLDTVKLVMQQASGATPNAAVNCKVEVYAIVDNDITPGADVDDGLPIDTSEPRVYADWGLG